MSVTCAELSVTSMCYDSINVNCACIPFNFVDCYDCLGYFGCSLSTGPRGIATISITNANCNCWCVAESPVIGQADEPWRFQSHSSYFDFSHCLLHVELVACKNFSAGSTFEGCVAISWACNNPYYCCYCGKKGNWHIDYNKLIQMEPNMNVAGFERERAQFCTRSGSTNCTTDYIFVGFYNRNESTTWQCFTSCVVLEIPLVYYVSINQ